MGARPNKPAFGPLVTAVIEARNGFAAPPQALFGDEAAWLWRLGATLFADYLTTLAPCVPDDAARRAAGKRIRSGGIEKGVDILVNRRCKGRRGMRWWRDQIERLVALRVTRRNNAWDQRLPAALIAQPQPAFGRIPPAGVSIPDAPVQQVRERALGTAAGAARE